MFGLTVRLALTNLKKNRRLYFPYALMTIVSTAIAYIFASLAFHPDLGQVKGADGVTMVLGFGMIVVMLAVAIMVFYANSFVMKQRSKEFGVYSILGLEKKHLLLMTFLENLVFAASSILTGLLLGLALDKLFYALLLKAMQMPVVLASTFQLKSLVTVLIYLFGIFALVSLFNIGKLGLSDSLKLVQGKKRGDKKTGLLWLQTLLALILLGAGYAIAQLVTSPLTAIPSFFGATLLVILGTYLLFHAGVISLLNWLKNRQTYYYKSDNFISVSNLIFRMRKNALGLATITILSSMFLVTMVGGLNIYIGGKDYIANQNPNDYSIDVGMQPTTSKAQTEKWEEWAEAILE
ncbi:FtsX-like permease family protein [Streptococcus suis]|nr:FtsX-like permease family protein [Streptococcus suis]